MTEQPKATTQQPPAAPDAATQQKLSQLKEPVHEELLDQEPSTHTRVIAIALDHSEYSAYAFKYTLENIINPKTDQVVLLNVRDIVNVPSSFGLVYMDMGGANAFGTDLKGDLKGLPPFKEIWKVDHVDSSSSSPPFTAPTMTTTHPHSHLPVLDWIDRTENENMAASHRLLKQFGAQVLKTGAKCRAIALRGDPRDELVYKTKELHADLFVIGSRGMGAIKRAFLGSVSDYCVHHCACPVLVVRAQEHEKNKKA
ncbi:hypothetical protein SpCBS45565_g05401 [Spizellomyces sp. 'palustris']|nr:hypothetical protein SpCBS45565_g05401 [Spizellomyces sp. 'palustris']